MRKGNVERNTKETKFLVLLNLDGSGKANISTGIGFFDHMLELFVHHSLIDMELKLRAIQMLICTIALKTQPMQLL